MHFTAEQLPAGLSHVQRVLPIQYLEDMVWSTVIDELASNLGMDFGVVGIWYVANVLALYVVFTRRR